MNLNEKKVSVIIPTYKRSEFLTRALDSVLRQTYKHIEVIIIDDNEPESKYIDETYSLIKEYIKFENVIYYKNEFNIGAAMARNKGISLASGAFITFLDDDDVFLTTKIEDQVNYMLDNDLDMCFMNFYIYNDKNMLVDYRGYEDIMQFDNDYLLKYHLQKHITGTYSYMYKKDVINDIGGFDNKIWGDEYYLMLKTIISKAKIGYLNKCLVVHYIYDSGTLTSGASKISGVHELHKFKKKFYNTLSLRERMFVEFRHNTVLAVTYLRGKKLLLGSIYAVLAFLYSPVDFIKEITQRRMKINSKSLLFSADLISNDKA